MSGWGERYCNKVNNVKNNAIFEPPSMRACFSTPPKQNQDFLKEHNRTPLKAEEFQMNSVILTGKYNKEYSFRVPHTRAYSMSNTGALRIHSDELNNSTDRLTESETLMRPELINISVLNSYI